MEVEVCPTQVDYRGFLKAMYFQKDAGQRLFLLLVVSLVIGNTRVLGEAFQLTQFLLRAAIAAVVLLFISAVIPYFRGSMKLKRQFENEGVPSPILVSTREDGMTVRTNSENLFWRWEALKSADIVTEYLYFTLFTNKIYVIPLRFFSSENEAVNFLGLLKTGILRTRGQSKERKVHNLYWWGLVGFVPNFGVIAGVILAIKGFNYKDKKLIAIGVACILFTVAFWTFIYNFIVPR